MNKQLNEQISRIKDMMKKVTTESFEGTEQPQGPNIDPELKEEILYYADKIQREEYDDISDYETGKWVSFSFGPDGNEIYLEYEYDVNPGSAPSYDPGVDRYSNGDPGYPASESPGEGDIDITNLKVINQRSDGYDVLYDGPDFTNVKFPSKMEEKIIDHYWDNYEPDYDYDDYGPED